MELTKLLWAEHIYPAIDEMLNKGFEFNCGRHIKNSVYSKDFDDGIGYYAVFFIEPSDDLQHKQELIQYLDWDSSGHGNTLLEAIQQAREIALKKYGIN